MKYPAWPLTTNEKADGDLSRAVLVIDDDGSVRALVNAVLSGRGLKVIQAADGKTGIARVQDSPQGFGLILIDYRMPDMDGLAATRVIRKYSPRSRLVLMSTEDPAADLAATGLREFLPKPFAAGDLIRLVDRHLSD